MSRVNKVGVCLASFILVMAIAAPARAEAQLQVIWIALDGRVKLNKVAPGSTLEGKLTRDVYWRNAEIFSKGSTVHLVVEKLESRRKPFAVDDRPFVIHLFAPRHDLTARFRSVEVVTARGEKVPLQATFIALSQRAELSASPKKSSKEAEKPNPTGGASGANPQPHATPAPWVLTLQVQPQDTTFSSLAALYPASPSVPEPAPCPGACTLADGTRMPLVLMAGLSAGKNRQGETVQAVLLEPVRVGASLAIPQGSILQGVLARRVPPRRLYRPGSLYLQFDHLTLPNGASAKIVASPVSAEVDRGTHMMMDAEGRIHAQNPGKARFLLDFGVTGGISKVSDDTTQMIIEAISSTATDASTAGVARFAAMGASAIFLLTRHGRDVILPPYTEMDVSLNRSVSLGDPAAGQKSEN
jgi:hypothetical protein